MYTVNHRLWSWFDESHIGEALVGDPPYSIGAPTRRESHDRLLAVRQLLMWSADRDQWDQAAAELIRAIRDLAGAHRLRDGYDLLWCYILVRDDMKEELPLDVDSLRLELAEARRCDDVEDGEITAVARAVDEAQA